MKTITLWNVPVDIALDVVRMMRKKLSDMILNGINSDEFYSMICTIEHIEEDIKNELVEVEA